MILTAMDLRSLAATDLRSLAATSGTGLATTTSLATTTLTSAKVRETILGGALVRPVLILPPGAVGVRLALEIRRVLLCILLPL